MQQVRTTLIGFGGMGSIYAKMIFTGMVPGMKLTGVCCCNEAGEGSHPRGRETLSQRPPAAAGNGKESVKWI